MSGQILLGWATTKQGLMCLAQGLNAMTPVRLEPATTRSRVKHSTTEPLRLTSGYLFRTQIVTEVVSKPANSFGAHRLTSKTFRRRADSDRFTGVCLYMHVHIFTIALFSDDSLYSYV